MNKFVLALAAVGAMPVMGQTVEPLQSEVLIRKIINEPGTAWTFYGDGMVSKEFKDADIPGGRAIRVTVKRKGANPYDIGASYDIVKPIKAGDVIYFAVYMRAPELPDGQTASMPSIGVGQNGAPYAPIAMTDVRIGNRWSIYRAAARASAAYPRGQTRISLQLASDKQVIDLGPVFALDMGPDCDIATLPRN